MNCALCGTSLSTVDPAENGPFCSDEHRTTHALNNQKLIQDWMEVPQLATGECTVARFAVDPRNMEFPLQVEMSSTTSTWLLNGEPAGPLAVPYPVAVKPVWTSRNAEIPFLPTPSRPQSVILGSAWLVQPRPAQGILGIWGSWSPLTKLALFVIPVLVAAGTHFIVGGRSATGLAAYPPPGKMLVEDFKSGLDQWQGAAPHSKPWKWESSEGAMPQSLAVFKPALGIADYRLEFTADAIKNYVSWATHIRDMQNYHACQLSLRKSGSAAQFSFLRYVVANGREGPRTEVPLQIRPSGGSIWRIKLESVGDSRSLWINDEIANSWTEDNEDSGGIGFFAGKANPFLLKAVKVYEQLPYTASAKLR